MRASVLGWTVIRPRVEVDRRQMGWCRGAVLVAGVVSAE